MKKYWWLGLIPVFSLIGYLVTDSISGALWGIVIVPFLLCTLGIGTMIGTFIVGIVVQVIIVIVFVCSDALGHPIRLPDTTGNKVLDKIIGILFIALLIVCGFLLMWWLGAWHGPGATYQLDCDKQGCY
jgi:hypothetical protein